jgi:acetyl esterase/lipase
MQTYLAKNQDTLKWRVPLGLLILYLMHRRLVRTRKVLYTGRTPEFWSASLVPPHPAPADALPAPIFISTTQFIYSLFPVGTQHWLRDHGALRFFADYGIIVGGALALGWRPRVIRRMFGEREGREFDVRYGAGARHVLDIAAVHRTSPDSAQNSPAAPVPLSPVLIFCHGGAWGSGDKRFYRLLTQQFDEQLGFVSITPNYHVWPDASTDVQISDFAQCVEWTWRNCERYGGDPNRIYLMGHSSGAHILSLYFLRQLKPANGELKVPIRGAIGLSGVYDIAAHYEFESARGVMEVSPLKAANGYTSDQFPRYSAIQDALDLSPQQRAKVPPFLLMHGATDDTVPWGTTIRYGYALAGGFDHVPVALPPLPSHDKYHAVSKSSDEPLRSFTFPSSPSAPLLHVRIVGSSTDPSQCDHASFIFDILSTKSTWNKEKGQRERRVVGHTEWIMEAMREFMKQVEQREKQATPAEAASSPARSTSPPTEPLRANL